MKSPAASPTFSVRKTFSFARTSVLTERLRAFICPRCDDVMVAPARSQHVKEDVVRHQWRCESCGHQFRTSVRLSFICTEAARQAAVA